MKQKLFLLSTLLCLAVLYGCRSSRHAVSDANTGASPSYDAPTRPVPGSADADKDAPRDGKQKGKSGKKGKKDDTPVKKTNAETVTAKMNLTLESGGKKINVGGTYRLKYNDVIQLNLTYTMVFSISVGTLEMTRDYILLLDRLNKRYCKVAYSEVPSLAQAGIDFDYLQSIFWGEAATPPSRALEWTYDNWTPLGDGQFPQQFVFSLHPGMVSYKATFDLSNLQVNGNWNTRTEIPSKYTPVSLDSVLRALMSVAK